MTSHGPLLPLWTCSGCGAPWPCRTRRLELTAEYARAPASLSLLLRSYFVSAAQDLHWCPAGRLYQRFVGWTLPDTGPPVGGPPGSEPPGSGSPNGRPHT